MKTHLFTLIAALLLLGGGFAACNNSNDDDPFAGEFPGAIQPVSPGGELGDELNAFFDYYNLRDITQSLFFYDDGIMRDRPFVDTCVIINSAEEFQAIDFIDGRSFELPAINFDAYTLVIGQWINWNGGDIYILSQNLVVESDQANINLLIGRKHDDALDVVMPEFFWGLYPKFTSESIHMNVVRKFQ